MKKSILLLLLFSITLSIAQVITPPGYPGDYSEYPDGTILRHPYDSTKFLLISGGKAYANGCPQGLHFNYCIDKCDWPTPGCNVENVDPGRCYWTITPGGINFPLICSSCSTVPFSVIDVSSESTCYPH